jgi:L-alanine-DL-glutamate epimerase-like enolase superfamily enzyme
MIDFSTRDRGRNSRGDQLLAQHRHRVIAVEAGDVIDADFLRAGGFALVLVGAVAESFGIHLADHGEHSLVAFRLALRQVAEVGNLGGHEQHR